MSRVNSESFGTIRSTALIWLRRKCGFRQAELARKAAIDPSYLHRIESGEKTPLPEVALRIAKALGVELSAFYDIAPGSGYQVIKVGESELIVVGDPTAMAGEVADA